VPFHNVGWECHYFLQISASFLVLSDLRCGWFWVDAVVPECGGGWAVGDGEVADVAMDTLVDAVVPVG